MDIRNDDPYQAHIDRLVRRAEIERSIYIGELIGSGLMAIGRFLRALANPPRATPHELRHHP